jgi:hypothetical protein
VYLVSLRRAADSAALPETEIGHGISERPSGRLPSDLTRPTGSFDAGITALVKDRQMISFKWFAVSADQQYAYTREHVTHVHLPVDHKRKGGARK